MSTFKQIVKEFWIPLLLSIAWVLYNIYGNESSEIWNIQKVVNIFGPTFFLLSWVTGQFFRVKKQTKVEDSFVVIETRFNELFTEVEKRTKDMIGHISGGNSFPYFQISSLDNNSNTGILVAIHEGEYPLYDVHARIVDLQKFDQVKDNFSLTSIGYCDTHVSVGNMIPSHVSMIQQQWKIENEPTQSYNIFFTARNGSFNQQIRLNKINGIWVSATKVITWDNEVLLEKIENNYPRDVNGNVRWGNS
jgi:hypothetical protein